MTPAAAGDQGHGLGGGASPCPVAVEAFRFFPADNDDGSLFFSSFSSSSLRWLWWLLWLF